MAPLFVRTIFDRSISIAVTNQALIRGLKESGTKIRLIVSNPDNEQLHNIYSKRFLEVEFPEQHANSVRHTLSNLEKLVGRSASGGSLEIKVTDRDVSFSYIGVDTATPGGRISVELYLTKIPLNENPMFALNSTTDPLWFDVFRNQFDIFWSNGKNPYKPHKSVS